MVGDLDQDTGPLLDAAVERAPIGRGGHCTSLSVETKRTADRHARHGVRDADSDDELLVAGVVVGHVTMADTESGEDGRYRWMETPDADTAVLPACPAGPRGSRWPTRASDSQVRLSEAGEGARRG